MVRPAVENVPQVREQLSWKFGRPPPLGTPAASRRILAYFIRKICTKDPCLMSAEPWHLTCLICGLMSWQAPKSWETMSYSYSATSYRFYISTSILRGKVDVMPRLYLLSRYILSHSRLECQTYSHKQLTLILTLPYWVSFYGDILAFSFLYCLKCINSKRLTVKRLKIIGLT